MIRIIFILFLSSTWCYSQDLFNDEQRYEVLQDSTENDTIKKHSVLAAVLLSTAVPGAGQVYNHIAMPKGKKKAYWKVPLIYAGLGASTYLLIQNQKQQKSLKTEYILRLDGLDGDPQWAEYDTDGVLTLHNQYLNWRDLSIAAVSLVYILQVVDAGVEAHFVSFDVSQDLSLALDPTVLNRNTVGLSLSLNFR